MREAKQLASDSNLLFLETKRLSNEELIDGLISGKATAARAFHTRYSARVSRWVWRLLGSDSEHDDVVQQVFLNVLSSLGRLKKSDSLDAWVDSVTIRTVRYELRKRKAQRALFLRSTAMDVCLSKDTNSPFKQAHIRSFYAILDSMPVNDRIIFVLRYLEHYSIDQIAALGNYSHSTAKRRLKKAKSQFAKRAMKEFCLVSLVEECHAT